MVQDRAARYESSSEQAFSLGPPTDPRRRPPPSSRSPSARIPRTPTASRKPINDKGKLKANERAALAPLGRRRGNLADMASQMSEVHNSKATAVKVPSDGEMSSADARADGYEEWKPV